jgi:excisionase family DNA binding protein
VQRLPAEHPKGLDLPVPVDKKTSGQRLVNEQEAAAYLGVKPGTLTVWRATKRYGLPYIRVGRLVRYRWADLERWLESRTVSSPDASL